GEPGRRGWASLAAPPRARRFRWRRSTLDIRLWPDGTPRERRCPARRPPRARERLGLAPCSSTLVSLESRETSHHSRSQSVQDEGACWRLICHDRVSAEMRKACLESWDAPKPPVNRVPRPPRDRYAISHAALAPGSRFRG